MRKDVTEKQFLTLKSEYSLWSL